MYLQHYLPIIYICFGTIPDYLHLNIELAARNNPVIVISTQTETDLLGNYLQASGTVDVKYVKLSEYQDGANAFTPYYKHMVICNISNIR